jgi:hypothetical protein
LLKALKNIVCGKINDPGKQIFLFLKIIFYPVNVGGMQIFLY